MALFNPFRAKKILDRMGFQILSESAVKENFNDIYAYRFPEVVRKRTMLDLGIDEELLSVVETSFLVYVKTVRLHGVNEMIDSTVDTLWHNFLLDTKAYMRFCSEYLGEFFHHIPYVDKKPIDTSEKFAMEKWLRSVVNNDRSKIKKRVSYTKKNLPNGFDHPICRWVFDELDDSYNKRLLKKIEKDSTGASYVMRDSAIDNNSSVGAANAAVAGAEITAATDPDPPAAPHAVQLAPAEKERKRLPLKSCRQREDLRT